MYAQMLQAILNQTGEKIIIQSAIPGSEDADKLWIKNSGTSSDGWFIFFNGVWCRPYYVPPDSDEIKIWNGTLTDAKLLDRPLGALPAPDPVSDTSGPFWQEATEFQGRTPFGQNGGTIMQGTDGGEEKHVLTIAEMPSHTHVLTINAGNNGGGGAAIEGITSGAYNIVPPTVIPLQNSWQVANAGSDVAHQNMPPWRGVFFLKRTARIFVTPNS